MTDTISLFRSFVRVVEAGSFTRVAREQNSSQPTVSRQVAALEEHLGARLFARTTRKLTLTDDGRDFYERARQATEAVSEAENTVGPAAGASLRRAAAGHPRRFGRLRVIPHLKEFLSRYPDVTIDLVMDDAKADLVEEGIDLAIRSGEVKDTTLIARKIGATRRVVAAAPSYLRGRTLPTHPHDLAGHDCITYRNNRRRGLAFCRSRRTRQCRSQGTGSHTKFGRYPRGRIVGPRHRLCPDLAFHRRTRYRAPHRAAERYEPKPEPIHAVYPSRSFVPQKTRVMIDFLEQRFAMDPKLSPRR